MPRAQRRAVLSPHAGQPMSEEIGATAGRTHAQVLEQTLDPVVAALAKLALEHEGA